MTRTGLVLGAGGTVGQAYEAGVLAALENDLGWDARDADVIAGTSAGAVNASLLRLGVPAHDLAAWAVNAPLSTDSAPLHAWLRRSRSHLPRLGLRHYLGRWRLPAPAMAKAILRRPWALRPGVVASAMAPTGKVDLSERAHDLHRVIPPEWPDGLRIVATCREDGARVAFGRSEAPAVSLPDAVSASCAIPGYATPQKIGGVEYLDGGVYSPTNADVLADEGCDLVLALAPMSAASGLAHGWDAPLRYVVHLELERELAALVEAGTTVVRFEPAQAALSAMGLDLMDDRRSEQVLQEAVVETGTYTASEDIAARLAPLTHRSSRRHPAA